MSASSDQEAPPRHRIWRRHGLLVRLLALCVAIASCSIGATAWVASVGASVNIQQQRSEDLTISADIYDATLAYAATHKSWDGVAELLAHKGKQHGRSIYLGTLAGKPIARHGPEKSDRLKPTVRVDPLEVVPLAGADVTTSSIDPRAIGPFQLTEAEKSTTHAQVTRLVACMGKYGVDAAVAELPNGRSVAEINGKSAPELTNRTIAANPGPPEATPVPSGSIVVYPPPQTPDESLAFHCRKQLGFLDGETVTEQKASAQLLKLINSCLERRGSRTVTGVIPDARTLGTSVNDPAVRSCVDGSRREQLAAYVAPPAWLTITGVTPAQASTGLSPAANTRIGLLALLILVLAVMVGAFAALQLTRPLRALTRAAQLVGSGDRTARVRTGDTGQIGELASAFNRMAEELDLAEERRKQMVSDIAHELRTPLGNIRGWLEATQDGVVTFDDALASSLLDESMLLQRIIEDLQELSLADAGKLVIHPEPIELSDLLRQIAAAHRPAAEQNRVSLDVYCEWPVQLTADANRLRQALGNLVSNAVRYTPAGGLVMLRAERAGESIVIEVSDTGLGMTAEEIEHVFDRFWRAEQSRSRLSGGSGLGLAITRHLIEAQSGSINVRSSEQGGGTVFTIRLPLGEDMTASR